MITRQQTVIEELHEQVDKLNSVNKDLERSWQAKHDETLCSKESELKEVRAKFEAWQLELKEKHSAQVSEMRKEFQHDMAIVDMELSRQKSALKEQVASLDNKL